MQLNCVKLKTTATTKNNNNNKPFTALLRFAS